jgi:PGF-pre-PGF domain-containing protein
MTNKKIKIFVLILLVLALFKSAYAIPVPHGIDGRIYDLDGITPARNVDFSVTDIDTGEFIKSRTDQNGMYSVSLDGDNRNTIIIKAWTKYNENNRTVSLQGVMRNVDLLLNLSRREFAPIFNSSPIIQATEDILYSYDVDVFDENEDELTYSLIDSPNTMKINSTSGLIKWIPADNQSGKNNVTVQVTDNLFNATQSFMINVQWVNDAPVIISEPINETYLLELYYYHVNATDEENSELNYSLIKSPNNMHIYENGLIKWKPNKNHIGKNEIIVKVMDNNSYSTQNFNITVYAKSSQRAVSPGGSSGGFFAPESKKDKTGKQDNKDNEKNIIKTRKIKIKSENVFEIIIKSEDEIKLSINELSKRPEKIRSPEKKVYSYIEINPDNDSEKIKEAEINFRVKKEWLNESNAEKDEVILNRYSENKWNEIETLHYKSDEKYEYYKSKTPGFSYFAISLKDIVESNEFQTTGPKEQFIISGTIYKNRIRRQIDETEVKVTNLETKDVFETRTGAGGNQGAYYVIIDGKKGDEILIEVMGRNIYQNTTIILQGDMKGIDFVLNDKGLSAITGYSIFDSDIKINNTKTSIAITILVIISLFSYCLFSKRSYEKKY